MCPARLRCETYGAWYTIAIISLPDAQKESQFCYLPGKESGRTVPRAPIGRTKERQKVGMVWPGLSLSGKTKDD